jgi:hypothetical protein
MDFFDATCGDCAHFQKPKGEKDMGSCWRHPPAALSIPIPASQAPGAILRADKANPNAIAGFMTLAVRPPVTADTLACGDFELPPESEAPGGPA